MLAAQDFSDQPSDGIASWLGRSVNLISERRQTFTEPSLLAGGARSVDAFEDQEEARALCLCTRRRHAARSVRSRRLGSRALADSNGRAGLSASFAQRLLMDVNKCAKNFHIEWENFS